MDTWADYVSEQLRVAKYCCLRGLVNSLTGKTDWRWAIMAWSRLPRPRLP